MTGDLLSEMVVIIIGISFFLSQEGRRAIVETIIDGIERCVLTLLSGYKSVDSIFSISSDEGLGALSLTIFPFLSIII